MVGVQMLLLLPLPNVHPGFHTDTSAPVVGASCWDRTNDLLHVEETNYRCSNEATGSR